MITIKDLKPIQLDIYHAKICPYCYSETVLKSEKEIYGQNYSGKQMIACKNYPKCNSYVGTHKKDGSPLGRLSNHELRIAKKKAHDIFDAIWQNKYLTRGEAYQRMSEFLDLDPELTHIGYFNLATCEKVKRWATELYASFSKRSET